MPSVNPLDACNPAFNATVSASAGSGKTWLLITRIVRLLIDGAEPGNIIALTFTRKAAGEMQIRLNQRLYEMATVSDTELESILLMMGCDTEAKTRKTAKNLYEKIIHGLYPVRLQTFHSFCQDILSKFPLEANIAPGFELLEDSSLLQRQAWQTLFNEAINSATTDNTSNEKQKIKQQKLNTELDCIMRFCNGPDNTYTALNSFLSHRSDWWAFTRLSKNTGKTKNIVDFACESLQKQLNIKDNSNPLTPFFNTEITEKLLVFSSLLREINLKTSNKHADAIDQVLSDYQKETSSSETCFVLLKTAFIKKDGDIMVQGRQLNNTLEKKLGTENAEKFIQLHENIASQIQQLSEHLLRILSLKINKAWYYTGNRYIEIFQQLKKEQRLLDFTDLEWKCYQLLQFSDNAHWIQYKIDQRIDHILVDEFQDTNPTQWHLLSPILEEIAANPAQRPRSVFLVGDEKQSIYSFRRANPALQKQASQWLAENLDAKATPLDFSRRSSAAIINCVNEVFLQDSVSSIMQSFSRHDTYLDTLPGKVVLCELFSDDDSEADDSEPEHNENQAFRNPLQQPLQRSITSLRHKEADYIGRQILQLVNAKEYTTDNGIVRHIDYGDIMILMRNRTHLEIYENALKRLGIPFVGSKKGGLLDVLEIQDLNCLLHTLVTPYNNLALAQVLKSPIFSASDDDLVEIASLDSAKHKHWYDRLLQLADSESHDLSKPLQRAILLLPRWRQLAEQLPVHDCLDKIFSEGNIINRYIAANRAENKHKVAANCQRFLELSLESDSGRYPGISRFLQKLNHLRHHSQNPPEEPLTQSNESRVSLITIHGSKGLEAPVIFLADCNNSASNKNAYATLVRWPASEPQPVNFQLQLSKDKTDSRTLKLQQEKLQEQSREELNLLYVALTRARQQLYISGISSSRNKENSWYQIISDGLQEITAQETTLDDINCRVHQHLDYDPSLISSKASSITNIDKPLPVDARLLKAITYRADPDTFIAPSIDEDNRFQSKSSESKSGNTDESTSLREIAKWRGIIIHRVLERLCRAGEYPASESLISRLQQQIKAETLHNKPMFIDYLEECIQEAVTNYGHPEFKIIFNPDNSQTYNEMPLMYKQQEQTVYGIVDRVLKTGSNITIIDYKSTQLNTEENTRDVALKFSAQLKYYRDGIDTLWPGHDIKAGILFTQRKEIVWF